MTTILILPVTALLTILGMTEPVNGQLTASTFDANSRVAFNRHN
jgi:hypothetical protein